MSKKPAWFKGIIPALVTPFKKDGSLDEEAYRELIRFLLPHVDGLVAAGTTGEFVYLSPEERKRVIEIAVEEAGGKVPVIAGTGAASTRETLELTRFAKEVGADAALVVTPFYLKPTFNEIYDHYRAVNKVGIPIIIYNIPQCAGTHHEWWTAEGSLLDLENVVGIKDSSGDIPFLMALIEKVWGEVGIFTGHDETVVAALAAGADGAILASANLIPDIWQKIYRAVKSGDLDTAREWQRKIQKIIRIVVRQGSTQAVKEGLMMMGLRVGNSRFPMMPGDAFRREDQEELRFELEALGKIPRREVEYHLGNETVKTSFPVAHQVDKRVFDLTIAIGEGFSGPPFHEIAHIDLVMGVKDGPVGRAAERALKEERPGHDLAIIRERPMVILVPTVTVRTARQRHQIYEVAARGINKAIDWMVQDGTLPESILDKIVMIVNAFVHPSAAIDKRIELNNFKAMRAAIRKAIEGRPVIEEILSEKDAARHPFKYAP